MVGGDRSDLLLETVGAGLFAFLGNKGGGISIDAFAVAPAAGVGSQLSEDVHPPAGSGLGRFFVPHVVEVGFVGTKVAFGARVSEIRGGHTGASNLTN